MLHEVVRDNLDRALSLAAERSEHGFGYPGFIENTFVRYLECGLLCHGFVRVHCGDCGFDRLVAFSCKTRGLCPSCNTRRMHDTAVHLVDRVLPRVPYRQCVMSFPRYLRLQMTRDPSLITDMLRPRTVDDQPSQRQPERSAFIAGFSLHANVAIHQNDREGIKRLCRYGLRPAFALDRLSWTDDGNIRYRYKKRLVRRICGSAND